MPNHSSRHLAGILRQIMQQLEEEPNVDADDVSFVQLKIIMLEKIASLEAGGQIPDPLLGDLTADPHL